MKTNDISTAFVSWPGGGKRRPIYIISDESEQIARSVMEEMGRGVTGLDATGLYSGTRRQMLCCVVSKKEISRLKELVREQDRKAFVIVSDVREVLGEGFIEY